jgi:hypothetical protein
VLPESDGIFLFLATSEFHFGQKEEKYLCRRRKLLEAPLSNVEHQNVESRNDENNLNFESI